jgi:ABC-type nitrate/sulfonate/bicarbonate transport system permease component
VTTVAAPPTQRTSIPSPSPPLARRAWKALSTPRAARLMAPLLVLVAWQFFGDRLDTLLLPTPVDVAQKVIDFARDGSVVEHFSISLGRLAVGFAIVVVAGTTLGVLMGVSRPVDAFFRDFIVAGITFPYIVWAFLLTMWIGYGNTAPVFVLILQALPYVASNVSAGVKDVPKDLLDMGRAYGVRRATVLRHLILPSLGPFFFAALRYGLSTGWKALIVAEVFAAQSGAGYHMVDIRRIGDSAGIVAWALYFVVFAILVERLVFVRISNRAFRWRPVEAEDEATAKASETT